MQNFHFSKLICPIGGPLGKETILTKAINNIDALKINLSTAYDDSKVKYVITIMKLDSGKTIMLELKGPQITIKNSKPIQLKTGDSFKIEFSSFVENDDASIFVDYDNLMQLPTDTLMNILGSDVVLQSKSIDDLAVICEVKKGGIINPGSELIFENFDNRTKFLNDRDARDVLRGISNGINTIISSCPNTATDIQQIRDFLDKNGGKSVKILAKCHTSDFIKNAEEISKIADGVIIMHSWIDNYNHENIEDVYNKIITPFNHHGKPIIAQFSHNYIKSFDPNQNIFEKYLQLGVDGFSIDNDVLDIDDPTDFIIESYNNIHKIAKQEPAIVNIEQAKIEEEYRINDYLIYSSYRAIYELGVKAIICYTENGYTAAKISSYKPNIPIIAFTKNDAAYRYINLLRAVKGYKIASSYDYTNIRQTGKEIVRMIYKGSITLDDRILFVHASNIENNENILNGIEIYKFKDM